MATSPSTAASSSSWLSPVISGLSGYFGSTNAGNAQVTGENNAIGTENNLGTTVQGIYNPQVTTGNEAFTSLGQQLGLNGQPANYAAFDNSPGYQFAVQQGTQAINREAAAQGSLYTPNTLDAVGQYVTGTASQNYNNYINQLLQTAGYGSTGNANLGSNLTSIGNNVAQLQVGIGNANASAATGKANGLGSAAASLPYGQILSGIGSLFNNSGVSGGSSSSDPFSDTSLYGSGNSLDANYNYLNPGLDTSNLGNLDTSTNLGDYSSFNSSGF